MAANDHDTLALRLTNILRFQHGERLTRLQLAERFDQHADSCESSFNIVGRPRQAPEIGELRALISSWRFYDHFRIDRDAPCRRPQLGTLPPVLHHDGRDLASALQTIIEIGEVEDLVAALEDAFPGSCLGIDAPPGGLFSVRLHQHGLLRPQGGAELSTGPCATCCSWCSWC